MALPYHPKRGEVLICDFDSGFQPPEMVKKRPAVVVSVKASHGRKLCTVVPFSTTEANPPSAWHHALPHVRVPGWQAAGVIWAKCDMLTTVSFWRLNKPYVKTHHGRAFRELVLTEPDMRAIDSCIRHYLGLLP
jgi:uncharacterized protein YifN (PemK superfamily)